MATPVIDLRQRLRGAGMLDEQADLIAGAFEQLDRRLRRLEVLTGVIIALQVATLTTVIVMN